MKIKPKEQKKVKLSTSKREGSPKIMDFKIREAKQVEHASMCADTPTFSFGV